MTGSMVISLPQPTLAVQRRMVVRTSAPRGMGVRFCDSLMVRLVALLALAAFSTPSRRPMDTRKAMRLWCLLVHT